MRTWRIGFSVEWNADLDNRMGMEHSNSHWWNRMLFAQWNGMEPSSEIWNGTGWFAHFGSSWEISLDVLQNQIKTLAIAGGVVVEGHMTPVRPIIRGTIVFYNSRGLEQK